MTAATSALSYHDARSGAESAGESIEALHDPIEGTGRAPVTGTVRIIGGRFRRRRVPVPAVPGLRPTPDRVRETVFNWLAGRVEGARCLDPYAGTGALGLEAASRGAARVVCVERDRRLADALEAQARALGADAVRVVCAPVLAWLAGRAGEPFDIVLMDPPFDAGEHGAAAAALEAGGWLAPDARVYLESRAPFEALALPGSWSMLRSNKAGQVRYHLASADPADGDG